MVSLAVNKELKKVTASYSGCFQEILHFDPSRKSYQMKVRMTNAFTFLDKFFHLLLVSNF